MNIQSFPIHTLDSHDFPERLREIPKSPKQLFMRGHLPPLDHFWLAVVGSRRASSYGQQVTEMLIDALLGYPVVIVSGLALGIDTFALTRALAVSLPTVALPGSGLEHQVLYPRSNARLAYDICNHHGALLSEFPNDTRAAPWTFPQRNRIMAGLVHAVLVIEAENESGSRITARLATEYNRDVLAVPGSIFSENSRGTHMLIREGATPIIDAETLIDALGFEPLTTNTSIPREQLPLLEQKIFDALIQPLSRDALMRTIDADFSLVNQTLSLMEIKGLIYETLGVLRRK